MKSGSESGGPKESVQLLLPNQASSHPALLSSLSESTKNPLSPPHQACYGKIGHSGIPASSLQAQTCCWMSQWPLGPLRQEGTCRCHSCLFLTAGISLKPERRKEAGLEARRGWQG